MTFLHAGLAAAGFACVAIPIVIHLLFRRRRKPTPWAAMRFLLEAMRRQRRRLRLETLLLLAARCLMLACLAAAIARPLLSGASG
ncbi:MAG: BatA domain-containing protein, partial [Planctomycetes bacterium]|nr:BatA domain-containing protein [Planctomycetota bacterium]